MYCNCIILLILNIKCLVHAPFCTSPLYKLCRFCTSLMTQNNLTTSSITNDQSHINILIQLHHLFMFSCNSKYLHTTTKQTKTQNQNSTTATVLQHSQRTTCVIWHPQLTTADSVRAQFQCPHALADDN